MYLSIKFSLCVFESLGPLLFETPDSSQDCFCNLAVLFIVRIEKEATCPPS